MSEFDCTATTATREVPLPIPILHLPFLHVKDSTPREELPAFIYEGLKVSWNPPPPTDFCLQIRLREFSRERAAIMAQKVLEKLIYIATGLFN